MAGWFDARNKFRATIVLLFVGALSAIAATWFVTTQVGLRIATANSERVAVNWARKAVNLLEHGPVAFSQKAVTYDDRFALSGLLKNSEVYRYILLGADGHMFWSSKTSKIGRYEKRPYFTNIIAKGRVYIKNATKKASEIDGFLETPAGSRMNPDSPRKVTEIYIPVMSNGKFVGALEIYADVTSMYAWADGYIKRIAITACIIVLAVFLLVAALMVSYGREKIKKEQDLTRARVEAEKAEAEARDMHAQILKSNDEVASLNEDLNKNIQMLREAQDDVVKKGKLAQLGQLTATIAHDMRNPLGAVRTSAFLVRRKVAGEVPGIEKALDRIDSGIERCNTIITELLDFSRSKPLELEKTNVDRWITTLVREQAGRLPHSIQFECRLGLGDDGEAEFDSGNMERVFTNLLANASEAMIGTTHSPLENPTENPLIRITTQKTDRGIEISVTDNGPGISEEAMAKILEPLFTTKNFGIGLGLPSVEQILIRHGGGLEIESTPGKGATFTAWFPPKHVPAGNESRAA